MKANPSLRRRFLWYIAGAGAILVVFYTVLIALYFEKGLETSIKFTLDIEARAFADHYERNGNTPLPSGDSLTSYLGDNALPKPVFELFSLEQPQHREMLKYDTLHKTIPDDSPMHDLSYLCDQKVCELIFLYTFELPNKQWLYMLRSFGPTHIDRYLELEFDRVMFILLPVALFSVGLFIFLALFLTRKTSQPIKGIANWADGLTLDNMEQDIPDFKFNELDSVALNLRAAFERISQVLENEHMFLRNASHELRTPVAVMSTNLALLNKLAQDKGDESEIQVLARLQRAAKNMQQLTDTLLWLSRDSEQSPLCEIFSIDDMVDQLVAESEYLLKDKGVKVNISYGCKAIELPLIPCRIVLSNLIRNAFQYTRDGEIDVFIESDRVLLVNQSPETGLIERGYGEYGFGLGLVLVKRICQRMGWEFEHEPMSGGMASIVSFGPDRVFV